MRRLLRLLVVVCAFVGLVGGGFFAYLWLMPLRFDPPERGSVEFTIAAGMNLKAAAQAIQRAGVDLSPLWLVALGRITGRDKGIQAGSYEITSGTTLMQLFAKLTRGDVTLAQLTIPEGKTFAEFRALVDAHPDLRHDTRGLSDHELLALLGISEAWAEGRFFPDTYLFSKQSSDLELYRRAYRAMAHRLAQAWEKRAADLPLKDPQELLILASIIEKETGHADDRPLIASVFVNRLRLGMPLQSDPTVIYGMGARFDGNLRRRDLATDTPWNTYTRAGLPPTPICLPGQASLDAAANPPKTEWLYFVARGDGTSEFSRTLDAHHRAVAKYQLGRR
ncbi:MAG: endolytic transglycosylase MltG [Rhodocyclaceae bacterium]|nr:endolytic transglycosylase MltG [Rhodocyclaceae bacterium]